MAKTEVKADPFEIVLDSGNYEVKGTSGQILIKFLHAVAQITEMEYKAALERYEKSRHGDFLKITFYPTKEESKGGLTVQTLYYVVGDTAQQYHVQKRQGAPRYDKNYYGVLFCAAVARLAAGLGTRNKKGEYAELKQRGMYVKASHASRDYAFRGNIRNAINRRWMFECAGLVFDFEVVKTSTFEEAFGGYAMRCFRKVDGKWTAPLAGKNVAVIDIGGGTAGALPIHNGDAQYSRAYSAPQGVNNALARLRADIKERYPAWAGHAQEIPTAPLQTAIRTGFFKAMGHDYDMREMVDAALAPLVNEINTMWMESLDGGFGFDVVVLTGGGSILLGETLKETVLTNFHRDSVLYAMDDLSQLNFANVLGAKQFFDVTAAAYGGA